MDTLAESCLSKYSYIKVNTDAVLSIHFLSSNTESHFVFGTSAHYKVTSGVFRYKDKAMKSFDAFGLVLFTEVPVLFTCCTTDVLTISPSPSCNRHG